MLDSAPKLRGSHPVGDAVAASSGVHVLPGLQHHFCHENQENIGSRPMLAARKCQAADTTSATRCTHTHLSCFDPEGVPQSFFTHGSIKFVTVLQHASTGPACAGPVQRLRLHPVGGYPHKMDEADIGPSRKWSQSADPDYDLHRSRIDCRSSRTDGRRTAPGSASARCQALIASLWFPERQAYYSSRKRLSPVTDTPLARHHSARDDHHCTSLGLWRRSHYDPPLLRPKMKFARTAHPGCLHVGGGGWASCRRARRVLGASLSAQELRMQRRRAVSSAQAIPSRARVLCDHVLDGAPPSPGSGSA